MILTVTLNPSLDLTLPVQALKPDQRIFSDTIGPEPGGKGVNVSRYLSAAGISNRLFAAIGGANGRTFQREIRKRGLTGHCVEIPGETRLNVTINVSSPSTDYKINGRGPHLDQKNTARLVRAILSAARGCHYAVLGGSTPPGVPENLYGVLTRKLTRQGTKVVVDAEGDVLRHAVNARPFLIKPNIHELAGLLGKRSLSLAQAVKAARRLNEHGVAIVIVSLGSDGAIAISGTEAWRASVPRIRVASGIAAGDSLIGGFLQGMHQKKDLVDCLRLGCAAAVGTVTKPGTGIATSGDVKKYFRSIRIKRLPL